MGNSALRPKSQVDDFGPSLVSQKSSISNIDKDCLQVPETSGRLSPIPSSSELASGGQKLPTVFRYSGNGKNIYISGSFDNWTTKIPLVKSRHDLFTIIDLPEGTHQYKYFVDGQWVCDEKEATVANDFGTFNNVVTVKPSDFEVFEALGKDCTDTGHADESFSARCGRVSPPGDYCQLIPSKPSKHRLVPPVLPNQLLQIILNQDVARHCEPVLLPEPNHVMLNHLYALSIKDSMMILSTTHRYRKKYITTVLYRPI